LVLSHSPPEVVRAALDLTRDGPDVMLDRGLDRFGQVAAKAGDKPGAQAGLRRFDCRTLDRGFAATSFAVPRETNTDLPLSFQGFYPIADCSPRLDDCDE
jgi:hypothetical protein